MGTRRQQAQQGNYQRSKLGELNAEGFKRITGHRQRRASVLKLSFTNRRQVSPVLLKQNEYYNTITRKHAVKGFNRSGGRSYRNGNQCRQSLL